MRANLDALAPPMGQPLLALGLWQLVVGGQRAILRKPLCFRPLGLSP